MQRTWTFGEKLAFGFLLVVLLTVAMGGVSLVSLRSVVAGKDHVIDGAGQDLIDAQRVLALTSQKVATGRTYLLTGEERYVDQMRDKNSELGRALDDLNQRADPSELPRLAAITTARNAHQGALDKVLDLRRSGAPLAEFGGLFESDVVPRYDALVTEVEGFVADRRQALSDGRDKSSDDATRSMWIVIGIGLATVVLAIGVAVVLTRSLTHQIGTSIHHVQSSSSELQAAATQQASGSREQASAMTEIATTIGELLTTSRQIAESARRVSQIASDTASAARDGDRTVDAAHQAVSSIERQVSTIVHHMLDLGQKSQQIGGIIEIINELANQTNILAINATIEAAGAGEAGRRFGVVGDEIRKLADRVAGSTREIRLLVDEIRSSANATVMATETGTKTVEAGSQRFGELATSFRRIGDLVETTTEAAREIELSTKQQATAVEQVNVAISNVAQATREAEAGAGQTLATATQLAQLSVQLSKLIQPGVG